MVLNDIVSNARAILAFEIGLPQGCQHMSKLISRLHPYDGFHYPIFKKYMEETSGLPIGQDRLQWDREKLAPHDLKLRAINHKYEKDISDACWAIIDQYANNDLPNL